MTVQEIKSGIPTLTPDERHEVSALLASIELEEDESYWERIRKRIADKNPENWVSADTLK